jgi:protein TonB
LLKPISSKEPRQIIVAFIVETDGHISGGRVIRGNRQVGQQILRVAKSLKWSPGKCNGKNVPVFYTLPMTIEYSEAGN